MGKRWNLRFLPLGRLRVNGHQVRGLCDAPSQSNKEILIDSRLKDREQLEVVLHELLHAVDWHQSEEAISRQAADISRVLWKLGYRLPHDQQPTT